MASSSTVVNLGDAADDLAFTDSAALATHTFTNAPHSAVDEDNADDDDHADLLGGGGKAASGGKYNFWSIEFYQQFFDVDTQDVKERIVAGMVPRPGKSFFTDVLKNNPDLWGPFWICTTLVVSVAVTGNLASYIQTAFSGKSDFVWHYDFHKVTLAATAVFSYAWLVPASLYGFLWWTSQLASLTFLELICLYGYALAIYIPVSVLWLIQYSAVQWILVLVAAGLSGSVIVLTLLPILKKNAAKSFAVLLVVIVALHLLLACGFMLYFFHVPAAVAAANGNASGVTPVSGPLGDKAGMNKRNSGELPTVEENTISDERPDENKDAKKKSESEPKSEKVVPEKQEAAEKAPSNEEESKPKERRLAGP
jgi:hypothetical protein